MDLNPRPFALKATTLTTAPRRQHTKNTKEATLSQALKEEAFYYLTRAFYHMTTAFYLDNSFFYLDNSFLLYNKKQVLMHALNENGKLD